MSLTKRNASSSIFPVFVEQCITLMETRSTPTLILQEHSLKSYLYSIYPFIHQPSNSTQDSMHHKVIHIHLSMPQSTTKLYTFIYLCLFYASKHHSHTCSSIYATLTLEVGGAQGGPKGISSTLWDACGGVHPDTSEYLFIQAPLHPLTQYLRGW